MSNDQGKQPRRSKSRLMYPGFCLARPAYKAVGLTVKARLPWLAILLAGTLMGSLRWPSVSDSMRTILREAKGYDRRP